MRRYAAGLMRVNRTPIPLTPLQTICAARRTPVKIGDAVGIAADDLGVDNAGREAAQRRPHRAKRPEMSLPLLLRIVAPASWRWSCARQQSCFTSCSHSGPEGGARFRTGAEGTMNAVCLSTP